MKSDVSARGYTVIELLVTLLLVAVILSAAIPSFRNTMQNARLSSDLERLTASLRLAQSVAARSNEEAFVCASTNGTSCSGADDWSQGWIVVEQEVSGMRVVAVEASTEGITLRGRHFNDGSQITFTPEGTITDTGAPGTFVFCDGRGAQAAAAAIITRVGLVRDARDTTDSGIVENALGVDVSC